MKSIRHILTLFLCTLSLCAWSQDYTRLSERTIMGTARYVGMGGAMTAVGGDPSAVFDNVAGLGLYQRSEILVTFDETIDRTKQHETTNIGKRSYFMCPHASLVFSLPTFKTVEKGVLFHNFMISYRRIHSYGRNYLATGTSDASLGALITGADVDWDIAFCSDSYNNRNALSLKEWGYVNEFSIDWAMNISNQWYVGAGLRIQSTFHNADAIFEETFDKFNTDGIVYSNTNSSALTLSGVTCSLSAGVIYRPAKWMRLGFGIHTPSIGTTRIYTNGKLKAVTDSLRYSYAPDAAGSDKDFHMPLHLSASTAFQIGAYGMIALQYDYLKQHYNSGIHSLRAGIEVIPVMGMYINAGYVYESTFKSADVIVPMDPSFDRQDTYFQNLRWSQYASCTVGYRGTHMIIQAAYQYRWQRLNLYAHEAAKPYDIHTDTHRIVLTIGWHRY